mmetsp:Transcript_43104/g.99275  ORF Transcript_43104/g.99275 Transcript_43104/m.99275 type:complete len:238 (+) Transcript_43104:575-1288(+)
MSGGGTNSVFSTSAPGSKERLTSMPAIISTCPCHLSRPFRRRSSFTSRSWNTKAPHGSKRISNLPPGYSQVPTIRRSKSASLARCGSFAGLVTDHVCSGFTPFTSSANFQNSSRMPSLSASFFPLRYTSPASIDATADGQSFMPIWARASRHRDLLLFASSAKARSAARAALAQSSKAINACAAFEFAKLRCFGMCGRKSSSSALSSSSFTALRHEWKRSEESSCAAAWYSRTASCN